MIKVLNKALNILEFLAKHPEGAALSAVAESIGEKATTTSNIVKVLADRGYLERTDSGWKLGISAFVLSGNRMDYDRVLTETAGSVLASLADKTGTAAVLSVWRSGKRYVLMRIEDKSDITVNREYPDAKDVYRTATGMVLLALRDDATIAGYIAENGIPNESDPSEEAVNEFKKLLKEIRDNGYLIREKQNIFEAAAIVRDPDGMTHTAIGIFMPLFRAHDKELLKVSLLDAVRELEAKLRARYT